MRHISHIVVHHTASTCSTVESITHWHVTHPDGNQWPHIGYHYVIDKVGNITNTLPIEKKGIHCRGSNSHSIGVCLIGNFDTEYVSGGQLAALRLLLSDLKTDYPGVIVEAHRNMPMASTYCPGYNLLQLMPELR